MVAAEVGEAAARVDVVGCRVAIGEADAVSGDCGLRWEIDLVVGTYLRTLGSASESI